MSDRTLFDKLWETHEIVRGDNGASLLWVDRHFLTEGSHHGFRKLAQRGLSLAEPDLTVAVADHYVPTGSRSLHAAQADARRMIATLDDNAARHGFRYFGLNDPRQGIAHVVGPEQGLTLPGLLVVCGDSHTSTHGAFGTYAVGVGATEVAHVLATQTLWQIRPKTMSIRFEGQLGPGVSAKDMALSWILQLGADGARGHAIEYAGSTVEALSMEGRMTLCNLSIEGGARLGLVAPDAVTFEYLAGRPYAPTGQHWARAIKYWERLKSDADASFDAELVIQACDVAPIVTWGTSPDDALPITGTLPNPDSLPAAQAARVRDALEYMGLEAGQPVAGIPVDQVFIGSCANGRLEDLRLAARLLEGRKACIPGLVSPGSSLVKAQAEAEGLDKIFRNAGLDWVESGCSMCVGMNGDIVAPGKRCAATSNRNFRGRQGPGARTHLMSPVMAAAAAITGVLTDVRPMLEGRL